MKVQDKTTDGTSAVDKAACDADTTKTPAGVEWTSVKSLNVNVDNIDLEFTSEA